MPAEASTLVSVIVTTRNSARTLERCLESIAAQTYRPFEVIVVDNHSSDATPRIAQRRADLVVTAGPERSAQRNRGAEVATGAYLLFLDADMVLDHDVVADALRALQTAGASAAIIPESSAGEGFWARCRALERSCYTGDDAVEAARLYTRDAFEAAGGFDLALTGGEDWDLSRRVAQRRRLPRSTAAIVHDEGRLSLDEVYRKRRYYAPGYLAYLRKHRGDSRDQRNPFAREAFRRNWRRLATHPVLTLGVAVLKSVEVAAVVRVAAAGRSRRLPGQRRTIRG